MALRKESLEVRAGKMESEVGLLKQIVVQLPLEMQNLREELTNLKQEMSAGFAQMRQEMCRRSSNLTPCDH
ncbi:MAG: hypothetical protein M1169_05840 [Firmicutes bacterium]|nr:hypothetical protein [Bacillota bacterium]